jgi:hypothetical protein
MLLRLQERPGVSEDDVLPAEDTEPDASLAILDLHVGDQLALFRVQLHHLQPHGNPCPRRRRRPVKLDLLHGHRQHVDGLAHEKGAKHLAGPVQDHGVQEELRTRRGAQEVTIVRHHQLAGDPLVAALGDRLDALEAAAVEKRWRSS